LVVVDPTTIPENLFESELFGHEKGAFTGAHQQKIGKLELSHQGTLFIDEVGEIPLALQAKFLRVLQEKRFTRVGGTKEISSDFRLVTATNRDLSGEVRAGRFREDLYYRINVMDITIPPLRERPGDAVLLAEHFLAVFTRKYDRPDLVLDDITRTALHDYHWPGNVRELRNVIERSVLMSGHGRLEMNLPRQKGNESDPFHDLPKMDDLQRQYIQYVLDRTGGRISGPAGAAEILGLKRTTLHSRMERLGLSRKNM
jgi:formate hydrogenlyase transcriptional activator